MPTWKCPKEGNREYGRIVRTVYMRQNSTYNMYVYVLWVSQHKWITSDPWSVWITSGDLNRPIWLRITTVDLVGNNSTHRENASIMISMYSLPWASAGRGPIWSKWITSNGLYDAHVEGCVLVGSSIDSSLDRPFYLSPKLFAKFQSPIAYLFTMHLLDLSIDIRW